MKKSQNLDCRFPPLKEEDQKSHKKNQSGHCREKKKKKKKKKDNKSKKRESKNRGRIKDEQALFCKEYVKR